MADNGMGWRIILTLVFLLILIGGVSYILFPSTYESKLSPKKAPVVYATVPEVSIAVQLNDKAGWKAYTNPDYGYSFMYPGELDIQLSDMTQDIVANKSMGDNGSMGAIKVHVAINLPIHNFDEMYKADNNTTIKKTASFHINKLKNWSIGNAKAVDYSYETILPDKPNKIVTYGTLIQKGKDVISIISWGDDPSIYKAILPTVKLTQ